MLPAGVVQDGQTEDAESVADPGTGNHNLVPEHPRLKVVALVPRRPFIFHGHLGQRRTSKMLLCLLHQHIPLQINLPPCIRKQNILTRGILRKVPIQIHINAQNVQHFMSGNINIVFQQLLRVEQRGRVEDDVPGDGPGVSRLKANGGVGVVVVARVVLVPDEDDQVRVRAPLGVGVRDGDQARSCALLGVDGVLREDYRALYFYFGG